MTQLTNENQYCQWCESADVQKCDGCVTLLCFNCEEIDYVTCPRGEHMCYDCHEDHIDVGCEDCAAEARAAYDDSDARWKWRNE